MSLILDTHVLLNWALDPKSLSTAKQRALEQAHERDQSIAVSCITLWEIAQLEKRKRIEFASPAVEWLSRLEANPKITILNITAKIAADSCLLDPYPKDPADRIIGASARIYGLTLLTDDKEIIRSKQVATI